MWFKSQACGFSGNRLIFALVFVAQYFLPVLSRWVKQGGWRMGLDSLMMNVHALEHGKPKQLCIAW